MAITARPYTGIEDFKKMTYVLREGRKASRHSGYIHIGDLNWWAYYITPRHNTMNETAFIWEDDNGAVLGWSLLSPHYNTFDVFVHPSERNGQRREQMLLWTEARMAEVQRQRGKDHLVVGFLWQDDEVWINMLAKHNYALDAEESVYVYMVHPLEDIPQPTVPDGFTVRSVCGEEDAEARAEVHRASWARPGFESYMSTERYRAFMQAPDYRPELDVVAAAPDGRFAASAMMWLDAENALGHYEPVGTNPEFRRMGLGKAVLWEGLRRVKALGAREATVMPIESDPVAMALYTSAGFEPKNRSLTYSKTI
ncbi:MAG: GNAT family N-acetyltransferase [Anaerolineae bacterium]